MSIDTILKELPDLSRKDLKQLKLKVDFFLQSAKVDTDTSLSSFYDSLSTQLENGGFGSVYFAMFKRTSNFKHLEDGFEKVEIFINKHFKGITKTQRKRLYDIFSEILLSDMTNVLTTVTIGTVARNVYRLPELVNKSFPDYTRCGLLKSILL